MKIVRGRESNKYKGCCNLAAVFLNERKNDIKVSPHN